MRRAPVVKPKQIQLGVGQHAKRGNKLGITRNGLIQKVDFTFRSLSPAGTDAATAVALDFQRSQIEVVRDEVFSRLRIDNRFLCGRELGLQLLGNGFGDLALDGKDIGQIAIVGLRPEMRIVTRIDELRVNANLARGALHAALQHMRDAELLRDLAQIARALVAKLHDARAADHFQIGDLRQIGEDLVLHAVSEEGVGLVLAQVLKRKNCDAFLRHRGMAAEGTGGGGGGGIAALGEKTTSSPRARR